MSHGWSLSMCCCVCKVLLRVIIAVDLIIRVCACMLHSSHAMQATAPDAKQSKDFLPSLLVTVLYVLTCHKHRAATAASATGKTTWQYQEEQQQQVQQHQQASPWSKAWHCPEAASQSLIRPSLPASADTIVCPAQARAQMLLAQPSK